GLPARPDRQGPGEEGHDPARSPRFPVLGHHVLVVEDRDRVLHRLGRRLLAEPDALQPALLNRAAGPGGIYGPARAPNRANLTSVGFACEWFAATKAVTKPPGTAAMPM